jgi:hypothetical protein
MTAGAVVACSLGACAGDRGLGAAKVPAHTFPVREYTYASGLRVVVEEDDTTPIAGAVLVVEAGSVDDPPDKAGLAHTVEHLLFRAPSAAGLSFRAAFPRLGASSFNAATGIEQTTYFAFVPRASLDDLVAALMGRMADPMRGVDDTLVAQELPVVAEEIRSRPEYAARSRAFAGLLPAEAPAAQWRKCRSPVRTIARPCSSAAAIDSASRTEPPGWITAAAPALAASSTPSRNGKNASDATTDPVSGARAFDTAMRTESTRDI